MKKRYKADEIAPAIWEILSEHRGKENALPMAKIRERLAARGLYPAACTISRTIHETGFFGFASGREGGYFLIPNQSEARAVVEDLLHRAAEMTESARTVARRFNLKNE